MSRPAFPPADDRLTPTQWGWCVLAGFGLGQLAVVVIDAAIGGPGPFVLFGW